MSGKKINFQKRVKGRGTIALRQFRRNKLAMIGFCVFAIIFLACLLADFIAPHDYAQMQLSNKFAPISWEHPFGTDQFGRDLFSRILKGGQISLVVAVTSVVIVAIIAIIIGVTSAYFGGTYALVVMRVVDVLMSIPALLMAVIVSAVLGTGVYKSAIAIAISGVANLSRTAYASALSVCNMDYLEAAVATGASKFRLNFKYILPNSMAPLIIQLSTRLGVSISSIASLSFLGLGVRPPMPEWGSILSEGRTFLMQSWQMSFFPGLACVITMVSVSFIGDGLRDALDPRLKR